MTDLETIFNQLQKLLRAYSPPYIPKQASGSAYDLWSFKDIEIDGRKRKEVFFASLVIQKSYVGFYFMPVYADQDIIKVFEPRLLKLKKGKSCFHIRELDNDLENQIVKALEVGHSLYQKRGWV